MAPNQQLMKKFNCRKMPQKAASRHQMLFEMLYRVSSSCSIDFHDAAKAMLFLLKFSRVGGLHHHYVRQTA